MPVNFPDTPNVGDTFTVGTNTFEWDGVKWVVISTDGIDVSDATAEVTDVLASETFYAGEDADIKTGTIPSKTAETFTPGTADQTITAGQYLSEDQTILGDADLTVSNIKTGVDIFGLNGTFTADATASASDILSGETAYVNGAEITGNIPSKGSETFTPTTSNQTISSGQYLSGTQTILGDANLIPDNIADGVSIFGVTGNIEVFAPMVATGGTVTDVNISGTNYRVHEFTSTGTSTFTVSDTGTFGTVDALIVAGGGSGGLSRSASTHSAGGGGAGGLVYSNNINVNNTNYTITVGDGGNPGGPRNSASRSNGENGDNSVAFSLTALGGGAGSNRGDNGTDLGNRGNDGGSGGGNSDDHSPSVGLGLQPSSSSGGFGTNGAKFTREYHGSSFRIGGGGGGAGQSGANATTTSTPGKGGDGLYYGDKFTNNFGENGYFAGGGGGGSSPSYGGNTIGGNGGGGNGDANNGKPGLSNTGGGGAGGRASGNYSGGKGGSGIVLIRYPLEEVA